VIKNNTYNK